MTAVDTERASWLEWRRGGIGGSDIAALLGLSNYASPYSLWCEKVGLIEPTETTQRQRVGQVLEDGIAVLFHEQTGLYSVGEQMWCSHDEHTWAQCTVDGFAAEAAGSSIDDVLGTHQKKTDGRFGWPDGVPVNIRAQCVWEMGVTQMSHCWLSVLHAGFRFEVYEIARDDDAERDWELMLDRAGTFWHDHVLAGVAPMVDGSDATAEALRVLHPEHVPGERAELDGLVVDLAERYEIKARMKADKARLAEIDNTVRATFGDAEVGTVGGVDVLTYRSSPRAGYVVEPTTVRQLRAAPKPKRKSA